MQTSKVLPDDIENQLKQLNIDYILHKHDPLNTMADLEEKLKLHHASPIKNLFFEDRKGIHCYLVSALKDTGVEKAFWKNLGTSNRKTTMAKTQTLQDVLGVEPGSVTPFALVNDVNNKVKSFILDNNIMKHEWVSFHPLVNTLTIELRLEDFIKWLKSINRDYEVLDLSQKEDSQAE